MYKHEFACSWCLEPVVLDGTVKEYRHIDVSKYRLLRYGTDLLTGSASTTTLWPYTATTPGDDDGVDCCHDKTISVFSRIRHA